MKFGPSVLRAVVVVVVVVVIAASVAVTLNAIEARRAPSVAEKVLSQQGQGQGEAAQPATAAEQRLVVLSPDVSSRWSRFWYGDPWNRDPVCGGDPICRDAYFRDWPYARRPDRRYSHHVSGRDPAPQAITITNTNTNTATVTPPPPPPPPPTQAQAAMVQTQSEITAMTPPPPPPPPQSSAEPVPAPMPEQAPAPAPAPDQAPASEPAGAGCNTCERRKRAMAGLMRG
jgi:hypothetical protein